MCSQYGCKESKKIVEERDGNFKISYLNVRSMKASDGHRKDIALDNIIMDR